MNRQAHGKQRGIVLVAVLLLLTLFEIVGVVIATYPAPERQCEQNPTVQVREDGCVKEVGPTSGRP